MKKIFSIFLCLLMLLCPLQLVVFAVNGDIDLPIIDISDAQKTVIEIVNYDLYNGKKIDYKTTITFRSYSENAGEIFWVVNGEEIKADGNGSCTIQKAENDIEILCYTKDINGKIVPSKIEKISVKNSFFDKLIAFFKGMFIKLPVVTQ